MTFFFILLLRLKQFICHVFCSGLSLWTTAIRGDGVHPKVGRVDRTGHSVTGEHINGLSWILLVLSRRGTVAVDMSKVRFFLMSNLFLVL